MKYIGFSVLFYSSHGRRRDEEMHKIYYALLACVVGTRTYMPTSSRTEVLGVSVSQCFATVRRAEKTKRNTRSLYFVL